MMCMEVGFDEVHDCQEAFRLMLHAVANPGDITDISGLVGKLEGSAGNLEGSAGNLLLPALTLLDRETGYQVICDEQLSETIASMTYAKPVKRHVPFLFVTDRCTASSITDVFHLAYPGTLEEPHLGSLILVSVEVFDPEEPVTLAGPGIDGSKTTCFSEYARQWVHQRDQMEYEYPTGVDLCFVSTSGELMMIPRKTRITG